MRNQELINEKVKKISIFIGILCLIVIILLLINGSSKVADHFYNIIGTMVAVLIIMVLLIPDSEKINLEKRKDEVGQQDKLIWEVTSDRILGFNKKSYQNLVLLLNLSFIALVSIGLITLRPSGILYFIIGMVFILLFFDIWFYFAFYYSGWSNKPNFAKYQLSSFGIDINTPEARTHIDWKDVGAYQKYYEPKISLGTTYGLIMPDSLKRGRHVLFKIFTNNQLPKKNFLVADYYIQPTSLAEVEKVENFFIKNNIKREFNIITINLFWILIAPVVMIGLTIWTAFIVY